MTTTRFYDVDGGDDEFGMAISQIKDFNDEHEKEEKKVVKTSIEPGRQDSEEEEEEVKGGYYRNPCGAARGHVKLEVREAGGEGGEGRHRCAPAGATLGKTSSSKVVALGIGGWHWRHVLRVPFLRGSPLEGRGHAAQSPAGPDSVRHVGLVAMCWDGQFYEVHPSWQGIYRPILFGVEL